MSGAPWVVTFSWQPKVVARQEGDDRPALEQAAQLDILVGRIAVVDAFTRQPDLLRTALEHESTGLAHDLARIVDGTTVEGALTYPEKMAMAAGYALAYGVRR